MINKTSRYERKQKKHFRIRKWVSGTSERPRLSVHKSNKHIYAQLIDDVSASTLVFCSTLQPIFKNENNKTWSIDSAKKIGEMIAKSAIEKGITNVVFDRGGFKFHGKIAALANAARNAGLKF